LTALSGILKTFKQHSGRVLIFEGKNGGFQANANIETLQSGSFLST